MLESISFGVERLCGALLYCTMLLLFVALVNVSNDKKKAYLIIDLYVAVLTIMAFLYVPSETSDLFRTKAMAKVYWVGNGLPYFFKNVLIKTPTPISYLLIYLCESTHIEGLLPAVSAFIFYRCIFAILKNSSEYFDANVKQLSLVLMFVMCGTFFIDAIGGIRTALSFVIVAKMFSDEILCEKSFVKHLPFYLAACLIHNAAIPLVIIVVLMYLLFSEQKSENRKYVIIFILLLLLIVAVVGSSFLTVAYKKMISYLTNDIYFDIKRYVASVALYALFSVCFVRAYKNSNILISQRFWKTFALMFVFDLIFIVNFVMFARYMMILEILFIPVWFSMLCQEKGKMMEKNILIINCFLLVISYVMGDMSAYKFFVI